MPSCKPRLDRTHLLHRNECARLCRSLKTAWAAGDVSQSCHQILDVIARSLQAEDYRYLPLTHSKEWLRAIRWAIPRVGPSASDTPLDGRRDRPVVVGMACRRLRESGYTVHVGALGPHLDANTRMSIAERVDSHVARIGGVVAVQGLCGFVGKTGRVHDGMWLFGNRVGGYDSTPDPALPVGWLLSIALRHIHRGTSVDETTDEWETAVRLAIDFAATMDCQRYNPFDGLNLDAPDFLPALEESLKWRELFTLPQVPPLVLPILQRAFAEITWPRATSRLRKDVDRLFRELNRLQTGLAEDRLTAMPRLTSLSAFPLLWRHARANQGFVNAQYLDPFGAHPRDHERYVFFETDDGVVILPAPLTTAAGCEVVFRLIFAQPKPVADVIVSNVVEKTVALACRKRSSRVWEKARYHADNTELEIDVAVRDGQEVVVLEAKAKSLTSKARIGDMMKFFDDYTNSLLRMLRQLVRHDRNIRRGLTPLTQQGCARDDLRITKVAVSPLSYGPASDHVLQNAMLRSMGRAQLSSVGGEVENVEILDAFNRKMEESMNDIGHVRFQSEQ